MFRARRLHRTASGAAGEAGQSSGTLSSSRLSWGESLLNSSHRVNCHMLLPAKHVVQLLLAGNPWGAHTKSIHGLLRWLSVATQHLIFHQVRDSKALGCVTFCKQNLRPLWQWLIISQVLTKQYSWKWDSLNWTSASWMLRMWFSIIVHFSFLSKSEKGSPGGEWLQSRAAGTRLQGQTAQSLPHSREQKLCDRIEQHGAVQQLRKEVIS